MWLWCSICPACCCSEALPYDICRMNPVSYEVSDSLSADALLSVLLFEAGGKMFAVNVDQTEGVVACPAVTPLPGAVESIVGVSSMRGRITVVIDLSKDSRQAERRRLILTKGEAQLGLVADRVEGIVALIENKDQAGGNSQSFLREQFCVGLFQFGNREVFLIDTERLAWSLM